MIAVPSIRPDDDQEAPAATAADVADAEPQENRVAQAERDDRAQRDDEQRDEDERQLARPGFRKACVMSPPTSS